MDTLPAALRGVPLPRRTGANPKTPFSDWVRRRLLTVESAGVVVAVLAGVVLFAAVALWLWALSAAMGWVVMILVMIAALV